jgi:hypothetical protein
MPRELRVRRLGHDYCAHCAQESALYEQFPTCRDCGEHVCIYDYIGGSLLEDEGRETVMCWMCDDFRIAEERREREEQEDDDFADDYDDHDDDWIANDEIEPLEQITDVDFD